MSVKILAIADEVDPLLYDYFSRERWADIDLILSCGDLSPDYLDFLASSLNVPLFYVRGNHDGAFSEQRYAGCTNVHARVVTHRGVRIAGFEGSRRYNTGSCQYTEQAMQRVVRKMRYRTWGRQRPHVVLAHASPADCHDAEDECHRGFTSFADIIKRWTPAVFVHGHTHRHGSQSVVSRVGDTRVINAFQHHVFEVSTEQTDPVGIPTGPVGC